MSGTSGAPSVTAAAGEAWDETKEILFRPFDVGRWFLLGFVTFLQALGQGCGVNLNFNVPLDDVEKGGNLPDIRPFLEKIREHLPVVVVVAVLLVCLLLLLLLLFQWLSSRGTFAYLHIVLNRAYSLGEAWSARVSEAHSFFLGRIVFGFLAGLTLFLLVLPALAVLLSHRGHHSWTPGMIAVIFVSFLLVFVFAIFVAVFFLFLVDFIAPIQYRESLSFLPAIRRFREYLSAAPGVFVVYVLLKLLLSVGIGLLLCVGGFLTCCLLFCALIIPVLSQTILQPWHLFLRLWPIKLLDSIRPTVVSHEVILE
ncbi:MAG: hypothetical protein D6679_10515 [Candidatus Hydrogenedentota bacterium]|nr:MAG: hypothetical protein D6679_10515 [Candidatus Hydrogenedentota bacterium]